MRLSYLIRSHDSAESLARTLSALPTVTPLPPMLWETRVIVGASLDEVGSMLTEQFPRVHATAQHGANESLAIRQGLSECVGEYVIVLDAHSHPMDHRSVSTALARMNRDPSLAAVSGRFSTSGGVLDEPLLPTVLVPGAICFRKSTLGQIGDVASDLAGSGSALDLSFRMWSAGFAIDRCQDMMIQRSNSDGEGSSANTVNFRDWMIFSQRCFPGKLASAYWADWRLRFSAIAKYEGRRKENWKSLWAARKASYQIRYKGRTRLGDSALEGMLGMRRQATMIGDWARENSVWRAVIADFSGNLFATYNACRSCGLQVRCIADNHGAFEDVEYRGLPIVPINAAFEGGGIEGVIVANPYAWQSQQRAQVIRRHFKGPILQVCGVVEQVQVRHAAAA